jgi:TP901-1 family phage major tail protein
MAAQKGLAMLLKIDIASTFTTVGGIRSTSLAINNAQVDVTSQDDTSRDRQLLAAAGVRSVSVSGSGVFKDDAAAAAVNTAALADTHADWQVVVPDFGTFEGAFQVSSLEFGGEHDGEVTFSISLESAGDITFTAA